MPGVWVFPGGTVDAADAGDDEQSHRACAVRELQEEAGIELGGDAELVAWSRWITPEFVPVRFDTRFYVTLAPAHSPPRPDGEEVTEAAWIGPSQALERHAAGELELVVSRRSSIWSRCSRTRAPRRCSRRRATGSSSRCYREWSAREASAGWSCPATRATEYDCPMTGAASTWRA